MAGAVAEPFISADDVADVFNTYPFNDCPAAQWDALDPDLKALTGRGNLNEAYIIGMTHVVEGVEQVRGTAINQADDCEFALVTGGPASLPVSGLILRRA